MFPITLWVDGIPNLDLTTNTWMALIALAVFCTSVPYLIYFKILKRAGSGNLMLVTLLIPPVAVSLGVFVLGESIKATSLIGFALIALGLVVVDGRITLSPKTYMS
jgi:drug/metabolite transporter (DMT)-like permease